MEVVNHTVVKKIFFFFKKKKQVYITDSTDSLW